MRASRMPAGAALCLVLLIVLANPAHAAHKSDAWARTQFATAEKMREALNDRPAAERTRRDYQLVMMAYRRVYYGAPTCSKADASVLAVADLLAESARRFDDDHALRSAIEQYEFLRREYPGSRYRFEALFAIGEIYQDDLNDPARARAVFQEFVRRYPHHHLAEEARQAMAEPVRQAAIRSQEEKDDSGPPARTESPEHKKDSSSANLEKAEDNKAAQDSPKPSRVTDVRRWSTPDSTHVQIDLDQAVKFESQRMDRPDRLVFDLLNSRLAAALAGKSFDSEDGLVKKIRVAQFQPGTTRVVLEVDRSSDCDAALLADPPRLGIEIHAKRSPEASIKRRAPSPGGEVKGAKTEIPAKPEINDEAQNTSADERKQLPAKIAANGPEPKTTIVEADDDDDNPAPAKSNRPAIKPASKTAAAPPPVPAVLPDSGGNSAGMASLEVSSSANAARVLNRPKAVTGDKRKSSAEPDVHEAQPTARGDRSQIRALGLKIGKIVIDPGHGGHDTGTIGPHGLEEKDLVLEVGRRLGKLLQTRLGADVVYTRSDDIFIPLETRTAIANQEQADLFVSIHANSSHDPDARGVETYYLNFTSSAEALDVAARENAASDKSIHELQDLVKKIALKEKVEESREFAADVQRCLHSGLVAKSPGLRDRGVKKAPFVVLIGANMPSILAEISFVSNPGDEKRLRTAEYRQRIAESLYRGIAKYVSGLSGVKVASRIEKSQGQ
ncbi:MAG TPA: N-acetylmuramoyl-L-alanine amidase [Terriglobales bacterium]|nr:N-acetylmuramoyl-L-alanine amidase [Terriglobales bacterium]